MSAEVALLQKRRAAALPAALVRSVETFIVDIPLRRVHKLSRAVLTHQSYLIVRLTTADGVQGIGEATVPGGPWWSGESVEAMRALFLNHIAPLLDGRDIFSANAIMAEIDQVAYANAALKSAVETALLDAAARTLSIPMSGLFGGRIADALPVLWVLATGELEADVAEAQAKIDARLHRRFKIKVGRGDPGDDARRAVETASAIGCPCSIDLNEAWSFADSTRALAILDGSGVDILEQPLPRADLPGLADLARRSSLAIMADESACSTSDMIAIIRERAASYVSLKKFQKPAAPAGCSRLPAWRRPLASISSGALPWTARSALPPTSNAARRCRSPAGPSFSCPSCWRTTFWRSRWSTAISAWTCRRASASV